MAYLSPEGHQRVSDAVAAAEARTAGEIVTVVADRSDGYSDIALVWAALVGFTALTVYALFPDFFLGLVDRLTGGWGTEWSMSGILALFGTAAMLKFLGTWLLLLWQPLRFALIPGPVKSARARA